MVFVPEVFKHNHCILSSYLLILFNNIFKSGNFPEQWSKSMIFPLHKKGSKYEVNNYRGVSLMDVCGKLFTAVLNNRLKEFVECMKMIPESQCGFRKGYSTVDDIFTLQSLVEKYLSKAKCRFYCLYVDFRKAFDSVNRDLLNYSCIPKVCSPSDVFQCKNHIIWVVFKLSYLFQI